RIAAASSVPVEIIGIEGPRSASGNYELAIRRFADLWARPHWRMACACLQHLLPSLPAASRLWYDVAGIAALREGELARGQALPAAGSEVSTVVCAAVSPGGAGSRPARPAGAGSSAGGSVARGAPNPPPLPSSAAPGGIGLPRSCGSGSRARLAALGADRPMK